MHAAPFIGDPRRVLSCSALHQFDHHPAAHYGRRSLQARQGDLLPPRCNAGAVWKERESSGRQDLETLPVGRLT